MTYTPPTGAGNVTSASGTSGGTLTVNKPANLANGDVLVVVPYKQLGGSTFSGATGSLTAIYTATATSTRGFAAYAKPITNAAGEPSTYSITSSDTTSRWGIIAFRLPDLQSTWLDAAPTSDVYGINATTVTVPGVTAVASSTLAIAVNFNNNSSLIYPTYSAAGWSSLANLQITSGSSTSVLDVQYQERVSAGATGSVAFTISQSAASFGGFLFTLKLVSVPTTLDNWLALPGKRWCAHRNGFYATYGEFTTAGFQALTTWNPEVAWNIDVYKTSDGEWAASHDQTTGRVLSGTSLDIPTNTWASISSKTTLVGGNPVTRIDDLVAIAPAGTIFFIDNKQNSNTTAFFAKLTALGLGPGNVVNKNFIQSAAMLTAAKTAGYKTWAYAFDASTADLVTNAANYDWTGFDYAGTQTNWNTTIGTGKPSFAHILASTANQTTADSKATTAGGTNFGYMVSNVAAVIPAAVTGGTAAPILTRRTFARSDYSRSRARTLNATRYGRS